MPDPRLAKLADVLVNYSARVRKDDVTVIRGAPPTEALALEIYRAVIKAGGHPTLSLTPDETEELLLKHGSKRQLLHSSPLLMHQAATMDVYIGLWGGRNTRHLSNCDPRRQALLSQGHKPYLDLFLKRAAEKTNKLRWVGSESPTQSAAQDADMSLAEYEDFVFNAGYLHHPDPAATWRQIATAQQRACDHLCKRRELRFIHPDGTDLRVGIDGRRWINCAGHENFPDGEVFTGPIEDATEGVVQYRFPAVYEGHEVCDARLVFRAGRVVECSASKGESFLISMLDQDAGARRLGEIAIGTNYQITRHMRNTLFDEKIGGTFHAALGKAYPESGGVNQSGLHWDMVCDMRTGGQILADGKVISRNGIFTQVGWPRPA